MWQIFFYEDHRGKSPVLDFMNALSARDRAKVNNMLRLLEEFGTDLGCPTRAGSRAGCGNCAPAITDCSIFCRLSRKFITLHGYRKRSMKAPEKEIAIALRRMKEFLEK